MQIEQFKLTDKELKAKEEIVNKSVFNHLTT